MKLVGKPTIIEFDPFSTETSQAQSLGEQLFLGDGRVFRYGVVGGANTSAGKLEQAPAEKPNHYNIAVLAAPVNTVGLSVTLGATAAASGEYNEGFVTVSTAPGLGAQFKISYNPAIGSGATGVITLSDPIPNTVGALSTATRVNLVHNVWNGFVEATLQTGRCAGVAMVAGVASVTAPTYAFLQTRGIASVLNQGAIALGTYLVPSGTVAGAVTAESSTFATAQATTRVGQALVVAGVDTSYNPMFLSID